MKQRDLTIDIIKGLGIFCMVAGHCGWPFTHFVYLFHMAVFFIASGYCFEDKYTEDAGKLALFVKKKFITLWFPYVLWTAIYSVLHNFFIRINVYTDNPLIYEYVSGPFISTTEYWPVKEIIENIIKSFFFQGTTQIGGAMWFLGTLMEVSVGYCVIGFVLSKIFHGDTKKVFVGQCVTSGVFLMIGYWCSLAGHAFYGLNQVFSFYVLYHGGYVIKKYGFSSKERKDIVHVSILVVAFVILLICNNIGSIEISANSYENPIFLLVASFVGWQFLYEIAFFIKKGTRMCSLWTCVGRNTLAVLILHFLCFKIVNYIGVLINYQPWCLVAAFPVLYRGSAWWVAYTIIGLAIPVLLSVLWKKSKARRFRERERQ